MCFVSSGIQTFSPGRVGIFIFIHDFRLNYSDSCRTRFHENKKLRIKQFFLSNRFKQNENLGRSRFTIAYF